LGEIFSPPLIQAQSWEEAQRKFNEVIRQMARMMNSIYTGANIPSGRLVQGTKIDGIEALADVTATHQAATIASQGALATKASVDLATGEVTNKTAANIAETATLKYAAETGADITGNHEAATIASQGALATLSSITSGIVVAALQGRKIYDNTLTENATSVTLSNLVGDTDKEYFIIAKWVRNGALNGGGGNFGIQCNGDTGVSNYGWQTNHNSGGGGAASLGWNDNTWFMLWMGRADTDGYLSMGYGHLLAESGKYRMLTGQMLRQIGAATIHSLYSMGCTWWNTADEITNLQFLGEDATSMKIGTHLLMYRRVD